ncbi:MAG: DUF1566 domain-containing protein [Gammaproteobacteria bacterium]|nr:DUF1566 domain-containing protein [Gammaproteobacteria bacterium]
MKNYIGAVLCLLAFNVDSALIDRGNGLIYDSDQDITWLQDANICHFGTNPFCAAAGITGAGRADDWYMANSWAQSLIFGGYDDWRLPSGPQFDPTCSFPDIAGSGISGSTGCMGSEMGYLFHAYGIVATGDTSSGVNVGPFTHLMGTVFGSKQWYATGTEAASGTEFAAYSFVDGFTGLRDKSSGTYHVWAVRDGDVSAVPIPAAAWLFGSGLLGLIGVARRTKA